MHEVRGAPIDLEVCKKTWICMEVALTMGNVSTNPFNTIVLHSENIRLKHQHPPGQGHLDAPDP